VAYFKVIFYHFPGGTGKTHKRNSA